MPIKFRQPQDINAIRFGATLVWGIINGVTTTVTGVSPLALINALAKPIKKLVQYGKCTTIDDEIYCNNGKLVIVDDELPAEYQRQIGFEFSASTYYRISDFHLRGTDTVRISFSVDKACNVFGCYTVTSAEDNYSLYASTSTGGKYLRYDGDTYSSYIPSSQVGERLDVVITSTGTTGMPTDSVITPVEFESVADLCIGTTSTSASSSKLDGNIWGSFIVDGRLELIPCKRLSDNVLGYYNIDSDTFYEPVGSAPTSLGVDSSHMTTLSVEGTSEVLTVGEQTASVENLLAVDDIKDEQNIISGAVTRRCEAEISDGTTPSGRYIGTIGEGNIIVKARETGYEGDIVTFEATEVKPLNGLSVNVEPIQDLHGYDSPWPAGGGENLLDPGTDGTINGVTKRVNSDGTITFSGTATSVTDFYFNGTTPSYTAYLLPNGTYHIEGSEGGSASTYDFFWIYQKDEATKYANGRDHTPVTVDGEIPSRIFFRVYSGYTINLTVKLGLFNGAYQANAWSPYSNICPISGRTSATIQHTAKNMMDCVQANKLGTNVTVEDGVLSAPYHSTTEAGIVFPVMPSTKYYVGFRQTTSRAIYIRCAEYSEKPTTYASNRIREILHEESVQYSGDKVRLITTGPEAKYVFFGFYRSYNTYDVTADNWRANLETDGSAYEPYQGNTYTIQLGDTVYGGTLDVTAGKMVVDAELEVFNRLDDNGVLVSQLNYFAPTSSGVGIIGDYARISFAINASVDQSKYNRISSTYKYKMCNLAKHSFAYNEQSTHWYRNTVLYLFLPTALVGSTAQSVYDYLVSIKDTTPLSFWTPLATPIEITLSPTQIETLLGTNNIWSDASSVKVYVADAELIEYVTPQPIHTAEGNNTVSVISAVDPVQLKIDYYKDE